MHLPFPAEKCCCASPILVQFWQRFYPPMSVLSQEGDPGSLSALVLPSESMLVQRMCFPDVGPGFALGIGEKLIKLSHWPPSRCT